MSLNSPSLILESSWFKLAAWTWTVHHRLGLPVPAFRRDVLRSCFCNDRRRRPSWGLLAASARVRHKRRQLRRSILDLVLTNYLPPEETQRAGDFDTEANGCLSTGRRVLVPGAQCGAKQMGAIQQNARPHLVERQLNLWSAPRL